MEKLNELYDKEFSFDIIIDNNKIYLRIHQGGLFMPDYTDIISKKSLLKDYNIFEKTNNIIELINKMVKSSGI